ncbi:VPLPA-CTERM sorting domain-containing protein [Lichenihabitans sp. Uapishka_5]|uniref:VPLPA-CTERM sorting domain-containing protein n=1 Tax=Lichenihabitans sp. Uapishka_5 TaxID=3037302 RepID=UPI0029E80409|nr:VPLPA-CTERM sorting domain-containing protein [Lichenihabitans sp. Uapishka_5]MDX7954040.1 VPLPA-CTERM sorting domain-containing protein [Lichenihabitans sp. Uapishka_5]
MHSVLRTTALGFIGLCAASVAPASAASIAYPNAGTQNPAKYSFVANGGDITGYYLGTGAAYNETLGLLVNGLAVASDVFQNHTTDVGSSYNFGSFAKGSILTFFIDVATTGATFYSDKSLNLDGSQHIYSSAYAGSGTTPAGTYVGFEDLSSKRSLYPSQGYNVDYNYTDEQFAFTNLSVSSVPLPAAAPMFGAALLALGAVGYGLRRKKAATAA